VTGLKLFIDGEFVNSERGDTFEVRNPATSEVIGTAAKGKREDVRRAVDSAKEAFRTWSEIEPLNRGKILMKVADLLRESEDELSVAITKEQGKTLKEAANEVRGSAHILEFYATAATHMRGTAFRLSEQGKLANILKKPVGVTGIILPWNYPVGIMAYTSAPPLMAGCTLVVKPASTTPLTSGLMAKKFTQAGLPKGVLNIVTGPGSTVGEAILEHPDIRKISFTGETETGKHVMEVAAKRIKRVTLELGGSDPMIVAGDADLDLAADAVTWSRFTNAGQTCGATKRLYLFEDIADSFIQRLLRNVERTKVGNGLEPETRMGPVNNAQQLERVEEQVTDAVNRGAKPIYGGTRLRGKGYENGFFFAPTLLTDVPADSEISQEECFGPALPIFRVNDMKEAIERANDSKYGLCSSVWTADIKKATRAANELETGYTYVNTYPASLVEAPFGGFKESGVGRVYGVETIDGFLETKSVIFGVEDSRIPW